MNELSITCGCCLFLLSAFLCAMAMPQEFVVSDALLDAMAIVESGNDPNAVNKSEGAIGVLQIRAIMLDDFNRISGKEYTKRDCFDKDKSYEMARVVLSHYSKSYTKKTGIKADNEVMARIWNGGYSSIYNNWKATNKYWSKVEKALHEIEARNG